jgi:ion channel/pentapeptide repeat protein
MPEREEQSESSLVDSRSAEATPIELPCEGDLATLRELCESMEAATSDARASEAIEKGLLRDLAPSFDPETRQEPPGRRNSVSAKVVDDLSSVLECFGTVAEALGYKPPAPNQRRYRGPELRLRYCQIDQCDLSMRPIAWAVNFCGSRFRKAAIFMGATFAARAGLEHCVFEDGVDFGLTKFQGDASFSGASFTATSAVSATFAGVTFCAHADFDLTRFASTAQFDFGTFEGQTRFFRAQFRGPAAFGESKFHAAAQFEFASFADTADFSSVLFHRAPDFHETSFRGQVNFGATNFEEFLDLRTAVFSPEASLNVADLRIRASSVLGGNVRLTSGQLKQWHWWPPRWESLIEGDCPRKIRAQARQKQAAAKSQDQKDPRQVYRKAIRDGRAAMGSACTQYGVLEENFRAQGDPDSRATEDFCHYRYHDLWRRSHRRTYSPLYWMNWFFLKLCFGYGVYPLRVLIAGMMLIISFACLYGTGGFGLGGDDWSIETEKVMQVIGETGADGVPEVREVTRLVKLSEMGGWEKWGGALYFSTVTFTTIGYGDWRPTVGANFAAAAEGLLGVFTMSVFTVVFARKFVR